MHSRRSFLSAAVASLGASSVWLTAARAAERFELTRSEEDWKKILTAKQFAVLRQAGTERPYTSALLDEHRAGVFTCAGCHLSLFSFKTKFESGTGWPSFWAPLDGAVGTERDTSFGSVRTSVHCHRCGGHLGHVFNDGPKPTGLRYCMNGIALGFTPESA